LLTTKTAEFNYQLLLQTEAKSIKWWWWCSR